MVAARRARARDLIDSPPRLSVSTRALPAQQAADLLALLHGRRDVVAWVRHGRGLVGWGRVLTLEAEGAGRIEELRAAWRAVVHASWWTDPLVRPGTGPVALGAIAFSASSRERSVLVVPEVIVGADASGAWVTTASLADRPSQSPPAPARAGTGRNPRRDRPQPAPGPARPRAEVSRGALADDAYLAAVAATQRRMAAGEARKVVLARDVMVTPSTPMPAPRILARLAHGYPSCWTFAVDGMVGATPELLVRLEGRRLACRVLAGTARRRAGRARGAAEPAEPAELKELAELAELTEWLEASGKNNREHELARASALAALEPLCSVVEAPERFVVTLPNVLHLASDITGVVAGDTGALSLVGALHPTAAVCGTPTPAAARIIEEVEGMDRGRYAGPVGWVDWHGEGEWCIALRSAALPDGGPGPGAPARVFGGGGIMPDSVPADELAETEAKMRPMLGALGALEAPA
ncbi:isochorismate synthase [Actinomyces israelii]|uniref:isochorismate synthase n=1 Tax=Actinomyces israelii TaxID=1659 RepID=UPI002555A014|nr:chorismate-binding protein [Actinomyces israelii]WKR20848.1 Isochorismate synthase MenF [Actinomyces israelii]